MKIPRCKQQIQAKRGHMQCESPVNVTTEVCVCRTKKERLMDGLVYTARGVQSEEGDRKKDREGEGERDLEVARGTLMV